MSFRSVTPVRTRLSLAVVALVPVALLAAACSSEVSELPATVDDDVDVAVDATDSGEAIGTSAQALHGAPVTVCKPLPHGRFLRVSVGKGTAARLLTHGWARPDCLGVCGGAAALDCAGVCNGGNVCRCTEGQMRCAADVAMFERCSNGAWLTFACAAGTACTSSNDSVVCDFPRAAP